METNKEVQGGKAIEDVFLLPAVQADFSELPQFDRASAILDSKNRARLRKRGETDSKE